MWNKRSFLLYIRIRLSGMKPRLNLLLPLSLLSPHQWLLSFDGALKLIPGAAGRKARAAADTLHGMLLQLMYAEPQNIADINVSGRGQNVRVVVRTMGFSGGEDI